MPYLRDCEVIIGNSSSAISLRDLRITFEVKKSNVTYPNTAKVQIYNLSEQTRNLIKNEFTNILINAGYVNQIQLIFKGDIKNIYHHIDDVDTITEIYAGDGDKAWQESYANITFGSAVGLRDIVVALVTTMPGINYATLNGLDKPRTSNQAMVCSGPTIKYLNELGKTYGFSWAIQNGLFETWETDGTVQPQAQAFDISAATGMIGSPTVTEIGADVVTLLNPAILPNRWINIQASGSTVNLGNPYFRVANKATIAQGFYIINTVTHNFDNRDNDALTTIETRTQDSNSASTI